MNSFGCSLCLSQSEIYENQRFIENNSPQPGSIIIADFAQETENEVHEINNYLSKYFAEQKIEFRPVKDPHLTLSQHLKELDIVTIRKIMEDFIKIFNNINWDYTFDICVDYLKINLSNKYHNPYLCLDLTNAYNASKKYLKLTNEIHSLMAKYKLFSRTKNYSTPFHLTLGIFPGTSAEEVHMLSEHPSCPEKYIDKHDIMFKIRKIIGSKNFSLKFRDVICWNVRKTTCDGKVHTHKEDSCRLYQTDDENTKYKLQIVGRNYFVKRQKTKDYIPSLHINKNRKPRKYIICNIIGDKCTFQQAQSYSDESFAWIGSVPDTEISLIPSEHICMKKGTTIVCNECFSSFIVNKEDWTTQIGPYCIIHSLRKWITDKRKGLDECI